MNPFKPLPLLALFGGAILGSVLFLAVRRWVPIPLNDLTSGAFSPTGVMRRVALAVFVCGGLGGAALAWLAWRIGDWDDSGQALALLLFGAATSATGTILLIALIPDPPTQLPWIMVSAGASAILGAAMSWWITDAGSTKLS